VYNGYIESILLSNSIYSPLLSGFFSANNIGLTNNIVGTHINAINNIYFWIKDWVAGSYIAVFAFSLAIPSFKGIAINIFIIFISQPTYWTTHLYIINNTN